MPAGVGQVDFQATVPLSPSVLSLTGTTTSTDNDCVTTITAWTANAAYNVLVIGFSP